MGHEKLAPGAALLQTPQWRRPQLRAGNETVRGPDQLAARNHSQRIPRSLRKIFSSSLATPTGWPGLVFAGLFSLFCLAFFLPISSKAVNNIFYAGLAVPALFWLLRRPAALPVLGRALAWVVLFLALVTLLDASSLSGLKKGVYLLLFLASCLLLEQQRFTVRHCLTLYALVCLVIFFYVLADWIWIWSESGRWIRYGRFLDQRINPVYFSLLMITGLSFLWLFHAEEFLLRHSRVALGAGLYVFVGMVLVVAAIFQGRSALLGFSLFLLTYLYWRRQFLVGVLVILGLAIPLHAIGVLELLLNRGVSHRTDIWMDALSRLANDCSLWLGCGSDDYRFLGKFEHPHSGYVSMLYRNGLVGAVLFAGFAAVFFARSARINSRWMLLALIGWGSLLTSTSGVITTPQPLWIYFWLPTFMAILESHRDKLAGYAAARCGTPASS